MGDQRVKSRTIAKHVKIYYQTGFDYSKCTSHKKSLVFGSHTKWGKGITWLPFLGETSQKRNEIVSFLRQLITEFEK